MPLDALCLRGLTAELSAALTGAKIDKIQQPERDMFLLSLRGQQGNFRLLISAGVGSARVHITEAAYENPQTPPMFCMLLRKHLLGARIRSVIQPGLERALILQLDAVDEVGEPVQRRLIVEMIGRHSNLILADEERIIDCLRRVDLEMSQLRQVLPGMVYRLPPTQAGKLDPLETDAAAFAAALSAAPEEALCEKWLISAFSGLSPLVARELVHRACGDAGARLSDLDAAARLALGAALEALSAAVKAGAFTPLLLTDRDSRKPFDFSFLPITQYGGHFEQQTFPGFSPLLEAFWTERDRADRVRQRAQSMTKTITNLRDRTARKLALQQAEYEKTQDRERRRELGDIITANLYRMEKGMRVLLAEDFYAEGCPQVEIPLDPLKNPQQNAAKYYKEYNKAKTAEKYLTEQMAKARTELDYLESVLDEIRRAEGERDLAEIRRELQAGGYLARQSGGKKPMKVPAQKPLRFVTESGLEIFVGRNNSQNDELTKSARSTDLWFHTQKIHGSHVILRCENGQADEAAVLAAASLAAWYSQGREAGRVPVDYTRVKFVKKPAGAKPGMVIYTDYKTLFVSPKNGI